MDWTSLGNAARLGLRPGKPLREPIRLLRVAIGMLVATIVGWLLGEPEAQLLVTVGAFLASIASLMPHHRSRIVAATVTSLAQVVAAGAGMALGQRWALVLPAIAVLFLIAGLLRAIAMSLSIRLTVVTIVFLAFAEISSQLTSGAPVVLGLFALGFAIMVLAQFLPPYGPRHSSQRHAVAALYRAIAAGQSQDSALIAAERSLALLHRRRHRELDRLAQLVERGEQIDQQMRVLGHRTEGASSPCSAAAREQLQAIAAAVLRPRSAGSLGTPRWPRARPDRLEQALRRSVEEATALAAGRSVPEPSEQRRVPGPFALVRAELRPGSPILRHAVRLAILCVVAQVLGLAVGRALGTGAFLAGHGFWAVVAAALIAFPDYGATFSRGIGRTIGTVAGGILGIALSFLPGTGLVHAALLFLLYCGYLVFRSCGQPYTMFWVVAWIASLTPGPLGATTRTLDTLIGCLLAFAAYLLSPTWQRRLLTERLVEWAQATARHLDALVLQWSADDTTHRLAVARTDVRARLTGLEFAAAARSARQEPRDAHGRWEDESLAPAIAGVTGVRSQVAALTALEPLWHDDERSMVCTRIAALSGVLDDFPRPSPGHFPREDRERHPGSAVDPVQSDTRSSLNRLRSAVMGLGSIVTAQNGPNHTGPGHGSPAEA